MNERVEFQQISGIPKTSQSTAYFHKWSYKKKTEEVKLGFKLYTLCSQSKT